MEQEIQDLSWVGHSLGIGLGRVPGPAKPWYPYLGTVTVTDLSQGTITDNGASDVATV